MNSDSQAGHKGAPASRSSKRSWGMNGWRYASIKGRTDKSRLATALCGPSGATTGFPQH